ncbi:HipA N-terminal domain-containing protein [Pseudarthrobacter sp. AB1]|uniref:HipA N-terminal domain-containing protein n=1 Tax=Pseudarthrobacter sp. AB1 TaxID=2138309 RepID=UPI0028157F6B|nr:HipA N-terminal domain-containing protein [Pseudarthrobacter sp. AB1]MBE4720489.1 hypothetical protein [Pseudarthrobacter sp. AB1]
MLINEKLAGAMEIETDDLSPVEHNRFTHGGSWIAKPEAFEISPEMPLVRGPLRPAPCRNLFGFFQDATPDDWGKAFVRVRGRPDDVSR